MLKLTIGSDELYDEEKSEFIIKDGFTIHLEHSLLAISVWEQRFCKPFLGRGEKTKEETLGYVEAMILDEDYPDDVLDRMTPHHLSKVNDYVDSPATATTFSDLADKKPSRGPSQVITSELIYYWMASANVPFECERWHLNRLFALLRIFDVKNSKQKKMSRSEIASRNRALNEQRKAQLNTRG